MRTKARWLAVVVILLGSGAKAWASWPCGIYARIEEVSFGPNEDQPKWILIKGDFIVVKDSRRHEGPTRGYLCFSLEKSDVAPNRSVTKRAPLTGKQKERCLIEWDDLKGLVAEKGKGKAYVAFGSAFSELLLEPLQHSSPHVWETADQAQKNQFPYPIHHGLTRLRIPDRHESFDGDQRDRNPVTVFQEFQNKKNGASR